MLEQPTMKLSHPAHSILIPDGCACPQAYERTTHLGIGAHQDDLEFMALHGILAGFQRTDIWFGGVTCTDGGGSARQGPYAHYTDEEMQAVRIREQEVAARIGQYSFMAQLGHQSLATKSAAGRQPIVMDLREILQATRPQHLYTHQPFDRHATHLGVFLAVLEAVRTLPKDERPVTWHGCEVWRDLDWLPAPFKVLHNVSAHPNLATALNGVFDSQIGGGKRYDRAVEGRRLANATFLDAFQTDDMECCAYAVDLSPLLQDDSLTVQDFVTPILHAFEEEVLQQLNAVGD